MKGNNIMEIAQQLLELGVLLAFFVSVYFAARKAK